MKWSYFLFLRFLLKECPSFTPWNQWSACSATCGGGVRRSNRTCQNGFHDQPGCVGPMERDEACSLRVMMIIIMRTENWIFVWLHGNRELLHFCVSGVYWQNIVSKLRLPPKSSKYSRWVNTQSFLVFPECLDLTAVVDSVQSDAGILG